MPRRSVRAPNKTVVAEHLETRSLLTVAVPGFAESLFTDGITRATQMDFAPDGRLFVSQQDGNLRVVKDGQLQVAPFVTVPVHNTGESGLIGVTFDPDFAANQFVYVYYTYKDATTGAWWNRVSRFTAAGDVAVPGSETVLIESDILGPGTWHNAGGLKFGADGKLYIGMGENQQPEQAQNLNSLLGKVLRINPDGTIPADNPFAATAPGKYAAIWAYGFRNPYTFDVEAATGRILVNDVGAEGWEEVNELRAGGNYGWPVVEGPTSDPAYVAPLHAYPHVGGDSDDAAIAGAAFYDPPAGAPAMFPADYAGDFIFGDNGMGVVRRLDVATGATETFGTDLIGITDLDVGPDGAVYYLIRDVGAAGRVIRVAPATAASPPTISAQPLSRGVVEGEFVSFSVTAGGQDLAYQWSRDGVDIPGATAPTLSVNAATLADAGAYRVAVSNPFGTVLSAPATLTVVQDTPPVPTIVTPTAATRWTGGGSIEFAGTATDAEDGDLPASAYLWWVDLHHDTHAHPFVAPFGGVTSGSIPIPTAGHDAEHNLWYRVHLEVTDSHGITRSTSQDVDPQKVNLSLQTEPAGLTLNLDGAPVTTPYESPAIAGFTRSVTAPPTQTLNGVTYLFEAWNDGGGTGGSGTSERELVVPNGDTTYVARYRPATTLNVALRASVPQSVLPGARLPGKASVAVTNASSTTVAGPLQVSLVVARADDPETEVATLTSATRAFTMNPGATKTIKLPGLQQAPAVPEGDYVVMAKVVAPDGSPSESPVRLPMAVQPARVDVAAADLAPPGTSQVPRRSERVRLTLSNAGNVPVQGPVEVQFAASTDASLSDDDVAVARVSVNVNLAPGRSKTFTVNLTYPPQISPGLYTLTAALDPQGLLGQPDDARSNDVVIGRRFIHVG